MKQAVSKLNKKMSQLIDDCCDAGTMPLKNASLFHCGLRLHCNVEMEWPLSWTKPPHLPISREAIVNGSGENLPTQKKFSASFLKEDVVISLLPSGTDYSSSSTGFHGSGRCSERI